MGVAAASGVDIDVRQHRHTGRIEVGEAHLEPGLLGRLATRRLPRRLARVDVTAGLQPEAQPLVPQQHDPARAGDDRRTSDMDDIGMLVERIGEPVELDEEAVDVGELGVIDRVTVGDRARRTSSRNRSGMGGTVSRGKSNKPLESGSCRADT